MDTHKAEIVEGLLKWWNARFGIVAGSRNANLYKLAAALNNYGIPQADALDVCLRYVDLTCSDPFTAQEITATVASAYRRTDHGVKRWEPMIRAIRTSTPPRRALTAEQARAIEDRLVDACGRRWPVVRHVPAPPPTEATGKYSAVINAVLPQPEVSAIIQRWAVRNPAINRLMDNLNIDTTRGRVTRFAKSSGG